MNRNDLADQVQNIAHAGEFEIVLYPPFAEGSCCLILNGRQLTTGLPCLFKKLHLSEFDAPYAEEFIRRFNNEVMILKQFSIERKPWVPRVYGTGKVSGMPFVALEKIEGKTLRQIIGDDTFDAGEKIRYCKEVLGPISEMHAMKMIHRDIKPANIIVRKDARVFVIDFSISKFMDQTLLTRMGDAILATVEYAHKKQLKNSADAQPWWDVFSWAVMTYHVVVGMELFKVQGSRDTISGLIKQHDTVDLKGTYDRLLKAGMSKKLAKIIVEIITDNGEKYPDAAAVLKSL